jgi:predicted aminopeptidase
MVQQWSKAFLLVTLCASNAGCYYMQAAAGHWQVSRRSEPIDEVIAEEDTSPELAKRLRLVQAARRFSVDKLGLPDNQTYRSYADIERDFVVWNVFAAPEFSLQPRQWCFPVAGCVSYRGYFSKDAAYREVERLKKDGYDVAVGGVSAYSTLGHFNDPVLSSMLRWDDVQIIGVLFHELAHQVLYVKGDSGFNESFATAVEEFGLEYWLESNGRPEEMEIYRLRRNLRAHLMDLVAAARDDLAETYALPMDDDQKRERKVARLSELRRDIEAYLGRSGRPETDWPGGELNNARLASLTLYEGRLPAFRSLFAECEQDFECFYERGKTLSTLGKPERDARLDALARR